MHGGENGPNHETLGTGLHRNGGAFRGEGLWTRFPCLETGSRGGDDDGDLHGMGLLSKVGFIEKRVRR